MRKKTITIFLTASLIICSSLPTDALALRPVASNLSANKPSSVDIGVPDSQGQRKKIVLLVDDEGIVHETLSEFLADCGYEVWSAASGDKALQLLKEKGSDPHFAIADIETPGKVDGVQLSQRLNHIPFILISGRNLPETGDNVIAAFTKPFDLYMIEEKLSELPMQPAGETTDSGKQSSAGDMHNDSSEAFTLDTKSKKDLRGMLLQLRYGKVSPEDAAAFVLSETENTPALTFYLISRLQTANVATRRQRRSLSRQAVFGEEEFARFLTDLIIRVNRSKKSPGRKLLPRLLHSENGADLACAHNIFLSLQEAGFSALVNSGTYDSHSRVRVRCLEMLAKMLGEMENVGYLLILYNKFETTQQKDFIAQAVIRSNDEGIANIRRIAETPGGDPRYTQAYDLLVRRINRMESGVYTLEPVPLGDALARALEKAFRHAAARNFIDQAA
ncbi:MAG: response regulator [Candidatus Omnitrophica bacterium]|nr:response regulator [Candidatus Omnitrophota bacterium]